MPTFLQLCQDVARESGTIGGDGLPSSVTGQTGRLLKVVNWTAEAYNRIQNARNGWRWMRAEFTGNLTASTSKYTSASFTLSRFAEWIEEDHAVSLYDPSVGVADEGELNRIEDYETWRLTFGRGEQTPNRPVYWAVSPARELCFGPVPDKAYTVRGLYRKSPQALAANNDVPELPTRFHQIIVWKALLLLAEFDEGPMHIGRAKENYAMLEFDLERDQLPQVKIGGGPIA